MFRYFWQVLVLHRGSRGRKWYRFGNPMTRKMRYISHYILLWWEIFLIHFFLCEKMKFDLFKRFLKSLASCQSLGASRFGLKVTALFCCFLGSSCRKLSTHFIILRHFLRNGKQNLPLKQVRFFPMFANWARAKTMLACVKFFRQEWKKCKKCKDWTDCENCKRCEECTECKECKEDRVQRR